MPIVLDSCSRTSSISAAAAAAHSEHPKLLNYIRRSTAPAHCILSSIIISILPSYSDMLPASLPTCLPAYLPTCLPGGSVRGLLGSGQSTISLRSFQRQTSGSAIRLPPPRSPSSSRCRSALKSSHVTYFQHLFGVGDDRKAIRGPLFAGVESQRERKRGRGRRPLCVGCIGVSEIGAMDTAATTRSTSSHRFHHRCSL